MHLQELELTSSELSKAVIGTIGDLDQPLLPEQQALLALKVCALHLLHWTHRHPDAAAAYKYAVSRI